MEAHIIPDLQGQALLSISTFCDAGCTALFMATKVRIDFKGKTVLTGARVPPVLWATSLNHFYWHPKPTLPIPFNLRAMPSSSSTLCASAQQQQHGPRPSTKASSGRLLSSHQLTYDTACQSPWQQPWGIFTSNKRTCTQPKKSCHRDKEVTSLEANEDISLTTDTTTKTMYATIVKLDKVLITGK
jgi:hypothetical protein